MGRQKDRGITSVEFGNKGTPARILIDQYRESKGRGEVSRLIRKLVLIHLGNNPAFREFKIKEAEYNVKLLAEEMVKINAKLLNAKDRLATLTGEDAKPIVLDESVKKEVSDEIDALLELE